MVLLVTSFNLFIQVSFEVVCLIDGHTRLHTQVWVNYLAKYEAN